jgi:hypothetical protein
MVARPGDHRTTSKVTLKKVIRFSSQNTDVRKYQFGRLTGLTLSSYWNITRLGKEKRPISAIEGGSRGAYHSDA